MLCKKMNKCYTAILDYHLRLKTPLEQFVLFLFANADL